MPCSDGRPDSLELYKESVIKLDQLTDLMCRTMKDAEEQGFISKMRGDAQDWWKKHQLVDKQMKEQRRSMDAVDRFLLLSTREQEAMLDNWRNKDRS